jgi:hypothetical protein
VTRLAAKRYAAAFGPLTRASLGAPSDRLRWGEAKGRAEGSAEVRCIGEAPVHGGCPHQFTGSDLARGMLERRPLLESAKSQAGRCLEHP